MENADLLSLLNEKMIFGKELVVRLQPIENIDGVMKLQRKIRQEIKFLKKLQKDEKVKAEQLSCSNLRHLGAMVECALREGVLSVCKIFHINDDSKLVIDIISDGGKVWTKVIARNPRSLSALSSGNASYGARSILDQADDYLQCAQLYPCMYQPPKIIFEFMSGIEESLANKLKAMGVVVKGEVLPDSQLVVDSDSCESDSCDDNYLSELPTLQGVTEYNKEHPEINTLNLDVTAMMAYVSNMTNGHPHYEFKQPVLTQQAQWELERPVKPILDKLFEGKALVCCETAWDDFEKIVNILGGPNEKRRTEELKRRVKVYPDDYGGKETDRIKALTISANEGFVRAAHQQGITYAAFVHESRALTEGKEATATKKDL